MGKHTAIVLLGLSIFYSRLLFAACACQDPISVCAEVRAEGSLVFIGTVSSISPKFLSRWNDSRRATLNRLNESYDRYLADPSSQAFLEWKKVIGELVPDLSADQRGSLEHAASHSQIARLFDAVLGSGTLVQFHVETVYRGSRDDDDDDDAGKPKADARKGKEDHDDDRLQAKKEFSVWTPFGDCGFDFQVGERYLVYAVSDEGTDHVETNRCMHTARLSDAGADLPFLYYYKRDAKTAGRLEGVATYDPRFQLGFGASLEFLRTTAPAPDLVIALQSEQGTRYAATDPSGRFVFDGLAVGDYQLAAYARGFPETVKPLTSPRPVRMTLKGCASQVMLIPRPAAR